jgi:hypothetical protein
VAAPVLITVNFIGGALDGKAVDFSKLPACVYRHHGEVGRDYIEYLLYLFEVHEQPVWGFVARGVSTEEAQMRLAKRLSAGSEGEPV